MKLYQTVCIKKDKIIQLIKIFRTKPVHLYDNSIFIVRRCYNVPMDKREIKTRQAIFSAMADLLADKDFESITVGDILERSKVSRSTFYSHFNKKEDVIKDLCDELFHHVLSPDLKKESGHDFSGYSIFEYKHLLTHFLFHVQEDRVLIKGISSGSAGAMFRQVLRGKLEPLMEACVKSKTIYKEGIDEKLQTKLFTETFIVVLDDWIAKDCQASPIEVADIFHRFSGDASVQ